MISSELLWSSELTHAGAEVWNRKKRPKASRFITYPNKNHRLSEYGGFICNFDFIPQKKKKKKWQN